MAGFTGKSPAVFLSLAPGEINLYYSNGLK
jgi:hypothetical protein